MILVARERRRDALVIAAAAGFTLILFGVAFYSELETALTSIPAASSYFTDAFSARNLPFGFAEALGEAVSRTLIAGSLLGALSGLAVARAIRTLDCSGASKSMDDERDALPCDGGLLVAACFFAGQNVNYRGIFLLPVLSGLICLQRSATDRDVRRF